MKDKEPSIWTNAVSRREALLLVGLATATAGTLGSAGGFLLATRDFDQKLVELKQQALAKQAEAEAAETQQNTQALDDARALLISSNFNITGEPLYGFNYPSTKDTVDQFDSAVKDGSLVYEFAKNSSNTDVSTLQRNAQKSKLTLPSYYRSLKVGDRSTTLFYHMLQMGLPIEDFNDPFKRTNKPIIGEIILAAYLRKQNQDVTWDDKQLETAYTTAISLKTQGKPHTWEQDLRSFLGIH